MLREFDLDSITQEGKEMPITKSIEVIPTDPELFQRRRLQIALAALAVFSKQGFHKTTVREIARAAGASVGTLYE